jgi:hypothetical protein
MNELVAETPELCRSEWETVIEDDPRYQLHQYIISPIPLPDDLHDEGGSD